MILTLGKDTNEAYIRELEKFLNQESVSFYRASFRGNLVRVIPDEEVGSEFPQYLNTFKGVQEIQSPSTDYQLASKAFTSSSTQISVNNEIIHQQGLNLVAGPCSVESHSQIMETAHFLSEMGINLIRGGAYKPRTSPYSFQGLGHEGLGLIREAADRYGLGVVTEVMDYQLMDEVVAHGDILQVGSRNMFNYQLLKQLGEQPKPVLLKRGMFAKIEEWLLAAEYIILNGNEQVILCERGLRTFDPAVRNQMDIAAIPLTKGLSHLPVWADPSQGSGRRNLIEPLSHAAVAAGVDGLMLEVHPDPDNALSDGSQSINLSAFKSLVKNILPTAQHLNKKLYLSSAMKATASNH